MAKSWADMSKEERKATGQTKKEYNRSTGQSIIPKYNQAPTPTPAPTAPAATPTPSASPAQADNRSQAAERAQNYTASASTQSKQTTSRPVISSQMEGYATDRKYTGPDGKTYTAKEADDAGWTAGYYDEGGGAYVPQQKTFELSLIHI